MKLQSNKQWLEPSFNSCYVLFRVSDYKGEPKLAAAIYNYFMHYMLNLTRQGTEGLAGIHCLVYGLYGLYYNKMCI